MANDDDDEDVGSLLWGAQSPRLDAFSSSCCCCSPSLNFHQVDDDGDDEYDYDEDVDDHIWHQTTTVQNNCFVDNDKR